MNDERRKTRVKEVKGLQKAERQDTESRLKKYKFARKTKREQCERNNTYSREREREREGKTEKCDCYSVCLLQ